MVRALCLTIVFVLCANLSLGTSSAATYKAGIVRITITDSSGQANAAIWYPSDAPEVRWQAGPFEIAASQEAPVAEGRFPVMLLSHGRGGGPLSHRELAAHLAREGFIVIAPTHLGDAGGQPLAVDQRQVLTSRPHQAIAALEAALRDEDRVPCRGVVGFHSHR